MNPLILLGALIVAAGFLLPDDKKKPEEKAVTGTDNAEPKKPASDKSTETAAAAEPETVESEAPEE